MFLYYLIYLEKSRSDRKILEVFDTFSIALAFFYSFFLNFVLLY